MERGHGVDGGCPSFKKNRLFIILVFA
jgi:hypothetical protein